MTKEIRMDYSEYELLVKRAERKSQSILQAFNWTYYGTKSQKKLLEDTRNDAQARADRLGERIKLLEEIQDVNEDTIYLYKMSTYILAVAIVLIITMSIWK